MKSMNRKQIVTSLLVLAITPVSFAAGGRQTGSTTTTGSSPNTNLSSGGTSGSSTSYIDPNVAKAIDKNNAAIAAAQKQKSQNTQAQAQQASDKQGSGMAAGLAGALFSSGIAAMTCPQPEQQATCTAALLGAAASGLVANQMGAAKGTSDQTVADVTVGKTASKPVDVTQTPEYQQAERNIKLATKNLPGTKVDLKTGNVTLPNGKEIKGGDLGNPSAMAAAGLSQDQINGFKDMFKKALKEGAKNSNAAASDADAGLATGTGSKSSASSSSEATYGTAVGTRDPANQVAGLSRNFNGEPIGVANENLFVLINRRYDLQAQKNTFLIPGAPTSSK